MNDERAAPSYGFEILSMLLLHVRAGINKPICARQTLGMTKIDDHNVHFRDSVAGQEVV